MCSMKACRAGSVQPACAGIPGPEVSLKGNVYPWEPVKEIGALRECQGNRYASVQDLSKIPFLLVPLSGFKRRSFGPRKQLHIGHKARLAESGPQQKFPRRRV